MSESIDRKADRLLAEGAVSPDKTPAWVYHVDGDHGHYTVVLSAHVQLCTCPARVPCAHISAALRWNHAEHQDAAKHGQYVALREARLARDRAAADDLFARLDA